MLNNNKIARGEKIFTEPIFLKVFFRTKPTVFKRR